MKKVIVSLLVVLSLSTISYAGQNEFCAGFARGYVSGYKQSSGSSFDPFVPFCPFQPFKRFNDPKSDYEHGYIIGFKQGVRSGYRR